jgi:CPA2 family monovalent cation:H+ antiporter-2
MVDVPYLDDIIFFLATAVLVAPLCSRFKVSPILGYLVAGVLIGPSVFSVVSVDDTTHWLAELGIVFLLFMIGLELSIERLRVMRRYAFGLGLAQVVISTLAIAGVFVLFGSDIDAAIVIGWALALSSTAFVLQILSERNEVATLTGRASVAVLLLQDLAVVPVLVLIPLLAAGDKDILASLGLAAVHALIALAAIFIVGRFVLRRLFRLVAATGIPEVFVAATLLAILVTGVVTDLAGLSYALGAFLAGLLMSGTEFRHQIAADIMPFRGLLLGLFFITVGMHLDLNYVSGNFALILPVAVALMTIKALIILILGRIFGMPLEIAIRTGLYLAQGGEFAFVILGLATAHGIIPTGVDNLLVGAVILSMAATPLLVGLSHRGTKFVLEHSDDGVDALREESAELNDHVIIGGYGRVGQTVAAALKQRNIPFVAVDMDGNNVAQGHRRGDPVFFGDLTRHSVLEAAGAKRARSLVIALDGQSAAERVMQAVREDFAHLHVLARTRDRAQARRLEDAGARAAVPDTLEASLHLAAHLLRDLGDESADIERLMTALRRDNYDLLDRLVSSPAPRHEGGT